MSTVATISSVACKKGLESIIGDIYNSSKGQLRMRFKRWKAKKNIGVIYTKIKNIRKVKTILQPEKAVDLLKFYYPSKLIIGKERKVVNDIEDIQFDGNIVIKGTVGQGKSILFRYLASREMVKGKKVPLFVELRRIQKGEKLLNHLVEEAEALGLRSIDKDTLLWLADEGKIVLLLDAFDEIPESERTRITNEIESLAKKYEHMQILVSSRPNSGIENSPFFQVFGLAPLQGREYEEAIGVMSEESIATNIIKAVRSSRRIVKDILTTPLMVALLIVRHRVEQTIPENMVGFYEGLFMLLISRHDRMKGGYTRLRKSGLGDGALADIFEAICFLTRKEMKGTFTRRDLTNFAKESIQLAGIRCDPDKIIEDIEKITCLILEEGEECRFIHKSVQEYHAACFIKHQPEQLAQQFYKNAVKQHFKFGFFLENWDGELGFLQMIDKYRFLKWFLIPAASRTLGLKGMIVPKSLTITPQMIVETFSGLAVLCSAGKLEWVILHKKPLFWNYRLFPYLGVYVFQELGNMYFSLQDKDIKGKKKDAALKEISSRGLVESPIGAYAEKTLKKVHTELLAAKKYIKRIDERKAFFEF